MGPTDKPKVKDLASTLLVSLIFIMTSQTSSRALGEYRAYELRLYRPDDGTERLIRTTFDDIQYPTYYPLRQGELIEIKRSWRCWGNTGNFKPICPNRQETKDKGDSAPNPGSNSIEDSSSSQPKTSSVPPPSA
ncbi:MAG: hypothetical protein IPJ71_06015 [Bdellovibrionales bacterium]|nr:hypothetical protein [Bdellovibrionales bacterium]